MNTNQNLAKLIEEAGLSEEEKQKFVDVVNEIAIDRILIAVADKLDEQAAQELEVKISQGATPEETIGFLKEKLTNFKEIVVQELEKVSSEMTTELT